MKKVIIIGASGSLARDVIEALKPLANVQLTMFLRSKNRLSKSLAEGCNIIEGDAMNYNDLKNAVAGQDIVYVNLAGDLETMAKNIVNAMQETGTPNGQKLQPDLRLFYIWYTQINLLIYIHSG